MSALSILLQNHLLDVLTILLTFRLIIVLLYTLVLKQAHRMNIFIFRKNSYIF